MLDTVELLLLLLLIGHFLVEEVLDHEFGDAAMMRRRRRRWRLVEAPLGLLEPDLVAAADLLVAPDGRRELGGRGRGCWLLLGRRSGRLVRLGGLLTLEHELLEAADGYVELVAHLVEQALAVGILPLHKLVRL